MYPAPGGPARYLQFFAYTYIKGRNLSARYRSNNLKNLQLPLHLRRPQFQVTQPTLNLMNLRKYRCRGG
jgi:hypothetical protein